MKGIHTHDLRRYHNELTWIGFQGNPSMTYELSEDLISNLWDLFLAPSGYFIQIEDLTLVQVGFIEAIS